MMVERTKTSKRGSHALRLYLFASISVWVLTFFWSLRVLPRHDGQQHSYDVSKLDVHPDTVSRCDEEFERLTLNHTHNLSTEDIRRSRAWVGNERRLAKVVDKLSARKMPISVVVYGGSISMGHGLANGSLKYLNEFEKWLNEYFPISNSEHKVYSRAGHGADMCFVAKRLMMMLSDIPQDRQIDMIILEFGVNDYQGQDHKMHLDHKTDVFFDGFERLALCAEAVVSKLLETFPDAAIVFLEFQTAILNRKTAQLLHTGVAQHYQIPVISYGETLFPGFYRLINLLEPFDYSTKASDPVLPFPHGCAPCLDEHIIESFRGKGCKSLCTFMKRSDRECNDDPPMGRVPCHLPFLAHDAVHPSMIGHQIAKDIIVHAIAAVRRDICNGQYPSDHILPPTTWLGSRKQLEDVTNFIMVKDTMGVFSKQDPLNSRNHSEGFKLFGDGLAERKGWIATSEKGGEWLELDVVLEDGCYEIILSILKSYEGMGTATIELTDTPTGRLIHSVAVDGIWEPRISVPADVSVTSRETNSYCSGKCKVLIRTIPKIEGRKGNKVKVVSLAAKRCRL
eukprot:scaffold1184_cov132-Cylindrotheca_fusiformis.AAC.48